jgi:hypothetical protein
MATVSLNITERKPVIRRFAFEGTKTLFVQALCNWPAAIGQVEPCIPLDINIGINQYFGDSVVSNDVVPLPNVGYSTVLLAPEVDVWVEYTNKQGLAIPYNQYLIAASVLKKEIKTVSSYFTYKYLPSPTAYAYPATGLLTIPNFAKEIRVTGNTHGQLSLYEFSQVGAGNQWVQFYDLQEVQNWMQLSPLARQFNIAIFSQPYTNPVYPASFTVSFRC